MGISAKYVHTNLIARDWQRLAKFYIDIFGCILVPPERDLLGPSIDAATAIPGAHIRGVHLRLPGWGDQGPTLEVFSYSPEMSHPPVAINRPGFGHIAFQVQDVESARQLVLASGGQMVGELVKVPVGEKFVTFCYLTDPEMNVIELQSWS